jgi:hypothetical protein
VDDLDPGIAALATDLRHALAASHGQLQLTRRDIDRGNVDVGRIVEHLDDLDASVRRVMDLVIVLEAGAPIVFSDRQAILDASA